MDFHNSFTDVHCHILPGLDDGARSSEQAREMFETAYSEGIRMIIATPHNYASRNSASPEKILETIQQLESYLKEWGIPILLHAGNEIFYRSGVAEQLEKGQILTLAGSRYVLTEFDPYVEYSYMRDGLGELARYGFLPVLAHAERYDCLFAKKERVRELKNSGIYFQVNASSFLEKWGSEYKKRAKLLLKEDAIDLIGTDAHSNRSRAPKIAQAAAYVTKKLGTDKAKKILLENPNRIVLDKRI